MAPCSQGTPHTDALRMGSGLDPQGNLILPVMITVAFLTMYMAMKVGTAERAADLGPWPDFLPTCLWALGFIPEMIMNDSCLDPRGRRRWEARQDSHGENVVWDG